MMCGRGGRDKNSDWKPSRHHSQRARMDSEPREAKYLNKVPPSSPGLINCPLLGFGASSQSTRLMECPAAHGVHRFASICISLGLEVKNRHRQHSPQWTGCLFLCHCSLSLHRFPLFWGGIEVQACELRKFSLVMFTHKSVVAFPQVCESS